MADFSAIAAVGSSIEKYLRHCFSETQPISDKSTSVFLARTEDLNKETSSLITAPCLGLYLYRVDFNKVMRGAWSAAGTRNGDSHLPVDLHFLFIPWADNADHECRIIGRVLQCMENMPIFSGPLLDPITNWAPHDAIQIYLEELSTEDVMRTFDSLPLDYKLSIPYVARIVVIDGQQAQPGLPVTHATNRTSAEVG